MINGNAKVKLMNRDSGMVGYTIPDLGNLYRHFEPMEIKTVTADEIRKLANVPGGMNILTNYLHIGNSELVAEILGTVEPEYHYTEEDIKRILTTGSLDELLDALDFAPNGVIDMIKSAAVAERINDIEKRNAIKEKTGFDVTKAIAIEDLSKADNADAAPAQVTRRRVIK